MPDEPSEEQLANRWNEIGEELELIRIEHKASSLGPDLKNDRRYQELYAEWIELAKKLLNPLPPSNG